MASWDLTRVPREQVSARAHELREQGQPGEFFIRTVKSHDKALGLTVRVEDRLVNYLLDDNRDDFNGVSFRGCDDAFDTLEELVEYYGAARHHPLPVRLIAQGSPKRRHRRRSKDDESMDAGYANVADLRPGGIMSVAPLSPTSAQSFSLESMGLEQGVLALLTNKLPSDVSEPALRAQMVLLQKQVELLQARQRAAELNLSLLKGKDAVHSERKRSPSKTSPDKGASNERFHSLARQVAEEAEMLRQLEREEQRARETQPYTQPQSIPTQDQRRREEILQETQRQMEQQLAKMDNKALVAGWHMQQDQSVRLRGNPRRVSTDPPTENGDSNENLTRAFIEKQAKPRRRVRFTSTGSDDDDARAKSASPVPSPVPSPMPADITTALRLERKLSEELDDLTLHRLAEAEEERARIAREKAELEAERKRIEDERMELEKLREENERRARLEQEQQERLAKEEKIKEELEALRRRREEQEAREREEELERIRARQQEEAQRRQEAEAARRREQEAESERIRRQQEEEARRAREEAEERERLAREQEARKAREKEEQERQARELEEARIRAEIERRRQLEEEARERRRQEEEERLRKVEESRKQAMARQTAWRRAEPAPAPTSSEPFAMVKRKIPPPVSSNKEAEPDDIPCTFLGNCRCRNCRS